MKPDRQIRYARYLGILFCVGGFVAIGLGWNGAARTANPDSQLPYLLSGGAAGIGLIVFGVGLMLVAQIRSERRRLQEVMDLMGPAMQKLVPQVEARADKGPEPFLFQEAIRRVEESGIVFIDEIDKIAGREGIHGPDVSREGVQRDLLPIVEGSTVSTKHGPVRSDHILFIASGAFHISKPSDLIPEFQGRFPIRVELEPLTKDDFVRILTEPENALTRQYTALLETERVKLVFRDDAVAEIARIAAEVNERTENIGARRLHTVMERLLDQVSFDAPEMGGREIPIDAAYVRERLESILQDQDLSRFIL